MNQFDWSGLLRLGVQQLRLRPQEFWQLTPFELMLCLGLDGTEKPLTRERLTELEALFSKK